MVVEEDSGDVVGEEEQEIGKVDCGIEQVIRSRRASGPGKGSVTEVVGGLGRGAPPAAPRGVKEFSLLAMGTRMYWARSKLVHSPEPA